MGLGILVIKIGRNNGDININWACVAKETARYLQIKHMNYIIKSLMFCLF